jgi:hypothetical protein
MIGSTGMMTEQGRSYLIGATARPFSNPNPVASEQIAAVRRSVKQGFD